MNETEKQHSRTWQSVCDEFFSTQQASYQESPCPLPSMRLPFWLKALFYRPAADAAAFDDVEMDITEDVKFHFAEQGREDVRLVARVHRISVSKNCCFRVVSAFLYLKENVLRMAVMWRRCANILRKNMNCSVGKKAFRRCIIST